MGCCGAYGYEDYEHTNLTSSQKVPVSCCTLTAGPGSIPTEPGDFTDLKACLSGDEKHINSEVQIYSLTLLVL